MKVKIGNFLHKNAVFGQNYQNPKPKLLYDSFSYSIFAEFVKKLH